MSGIENHFHYCCVAAIGCQMSETILNVVPGNDESSRLVVALERFAGESRVVLRQESYSDDVGWFVQSRVDMDPDQVQGLRMALGRGPARAMTGMRPRGVRPSDPVILRFSGKVG